MSQNSVNTAANAIRKLWETHGIKQPMRLLGFCLSLLPIPVIQQAGMTLDRHLGDIDLDRKLKEIWDKIILINIKVDELKNIEEAIIEIAKTASDNRNIQDDLKELSSLLFSKESSFNLETDDRSYQEMIGNLVSASKVMISASDKSRNLIQETKFISADTTLRATGGSSNHIHNAEFHGSTQSVHMHSSTAQGNVNIKEGMIGFSENSGLQMGRWYTGTNEKGDFVIGTKNPDLIITCPKCNQGFDAYFSDLVGKSSLQCRICGAISNIPSGSI